MKKTILLLMFLLVYGIGTTEAASVYDDVVEMIEINYNAQDTKANDINNVGQITGASWDEYFAFMRNPNGESSYLYAKIDSSSLGGRTFGGNGINVNGDVVATGSGVMTSGYQPLLYTSIAPPAHAYNPQVIGATDDRANAINSQYVAGYKATYKKTATIWDFDGNQIYTYGDNYQHRWYVDASENNVFIGQVENAQSIITHYDSDSSEWVTENYEDPGYGSITQLTSINGDGSIFCGYIRNSSSGTYYDAAVWGYDTNNDIVKLASLGVSDSSDYAVKASAISPNGQLVVGVGKIWGTSSWEGAPVVWEDIDGTWAPYTFESLLPVDQQGLWTNVTLTGVNDSGNVVGYGNYDSQAYLSGFVLAIGEEEEVLLEGDANRDGVVSAGDYATVQANFGSTGEPGIPGDANGDGVVSAGDYASVQANFGNTKSAAIPVPEPVTFSLMLIGGAGIIRRRKK